MLGWHCLHRHHKRYVQGCIHARTVTVLLCLLGVYPRLDEQTRNGYNEVAGSVSYSHYNLEYFIKFFHIRIYE